MKLSEFKNYISKMSSLDFALPDGEQVPSHFHITEAGLTSKHFIDCGGTTRSEKYASLQIWVASDTEHRLTPAKLQTIIGLSEKLYNGEDPDMEIEYQAATVGRYGLDITENGFMLTAKHTDCLAKEACGTPAKKKMNLAELPVAESSCCAPGGNCC